jgi:3-phenylpropionate/trans-cinnamate dioxygenase ferredoxin subunit
MDEPAFARVGALADLPPGAAMMAAVGDYDIALFNVAGEIFAIDDVCPHFAGSLHEGTVEDGMVSCPLHGWCFDLRSGTQTNGRRFVETFDVRVEDENLLVSATPRVRV